MQNVDVNALEWISPAQDILRNLRSEEMNSDTDDTESYVVEYDARTGEERYVPAN